MQRKEQERKILEKDFKKPESYRGKKPQERWDEGSKNKKKSIN